MVKYADYQAFCDRVCSYIMSYELGIPFQWDAPLPQQGNRGPGMLLQWNTAHPQQVDVRYLKDDDLPFAMFDSFLDGDVPLLVGDKRRYKEGVEHLRLTVIQRHIHYYQRTPAGEEYEIQPEGALSWLPRVPEHLPPPVTEAQLRATEDLLGFPLPPSLRALYERVANGGFGPGYDGLFCVLGCEEPKSWLLADVYHHLRGTNPSIDLLSCERHVTEKRDGYYKFLADWEITVPQGYWLDGLLPLSHDGCTMYFYLHVPTSNVFYGGEECNALRLMAPSLEGLFERWMNDDCF